MAGKKKKQEETVVANFATQLRPKNLCDVVGQEHVVGQIEGMVKRGKFPQAIMFVGEYSAGKTTMGRLTSKYANCQSIKKSKSKGLVTCGKCPTCKGYPKNMPDVHEVNCGDDTSVDNARKIISQSRLAPRYKYRVFILDEVHQATKQAQSALLKPLEEPPPRCLWILCTTDAQKVLPTVQSRCRIMRLKPHTVDECVTILKRACAKIKLKLPDKVLRIIASGTNAKARDALSVLEGVYNYLKSGKKLTSAVLKDMLIGYSGVEEGTAVRWLCLFLKDEVNNCVALGSQVEDVPGFLSYLAWNVHQLALVHAGVRTYLPEELKRVVNKIGRKSEHVKYTVTVLPPLINKAMYYTRFGVTSKTLVLDLANSLRVGR